MNPRRIGQFGNLTFDKDEKNGRTYPSGLYGSTKIYSDFLGPTVVAPIVCLGDDDYGQSGKVLLQSFGVDTSYVKVVPGAKSRVYAVPSFKLLQEGEELQKTEHDPIPVNDFRIFDVQSATSLYKGKYGEYVNETIQKATSTETHVDLNFRIKTLLELKENEKNREMVERAFNSTHTIHGTEHEIYTVANGFDIDTTSFDVVGLQEKHLDKKSLMESTQKIFERYKIDRIVVTMGNLGAFMQKRNGEMVHVDALQLGGENRIGLGDRFRNGYVIMRYLGGSDLEGLSFGSVLSARQALEPPYPEKISKESVRETILESKDHFSKNGIDVDKFLQRLFSKN